MNKDDFDSKTSVTLAGDLPFLFLSSLDDPWILPNHMSDLFSSSKSQIKELLHFDGANHTSNKDNPTYWDAIEHFVYRVLSKNAQRDVHLISVLTANVEKLVRTYDRNSGSSRFNPQRIRRCRIRFCK